MNGLQKFLETRGERFGSLQNLSRLMGVTFSGFLRGVKQGTLSTDNCLRLAEVLGEPPAEVLRAANKADVAAQVDRLFGPTAAPLSEDDRTLLAQWHAITPRARESLRVMLRELASGNEKPAREPKRRAS